MSYGKISKMYFRISFEEKLVQNISFVIYISIKANSDTGNMSLGEQ